MHELAQAPVLLPGGWDTNIQMALRWVHILAGIIWIGLLYFFNLVSMPVLPTLDAPTRSRVVTGLLARALWWFRWGAVLTVAAGFTYWVLILRTEPHDNPGVYLWRTLGLWFLLVVVAFGVQMGLLRIPLLARNTWAFVIAVVLVVGGLLGHLMVKLVTYPGASTRALSIAVGGGIGLFLLLNVWGIVWRAQKRLIAWCTTNPGQPPPPELAARLLQAQLVSRAGFWLTFPLLFFMAAASHYPLLVGG